ncbi:MAG: hypothetical protein J6L89_01155 [Clostridia bacterium]|nr:hypothetical protein [Clostridia bacterium]
MAEKLNKLKDILKKDRKMSVILIVAVVGILLLLASELFAQKSETKTDEKASVTEDYALTIEKKLSEIISSIEGAGKTSVMVTIDASEENVYAKQIKTDEEESDGKLSSNYEYEYIVIKSGTSSENGMLLKVIEPEIRGVAVVCDGGDNAAVRENIINTVSAVLDIKTNKISVCKRNG